MAGGWTEDVVAGALREGDELADSTVGALVDERGLQGAIDLLATLIEQLGVPDDDPALTAYLAATAQPAEPPDPAAMALAESMFQAHGWTFFCLLGCASLPEGYVVPDITRVLGTTQQLTEHVHRRLWETIQFTLDVTQPGGLDRGGPGIRSIQKVRLLHALVRYLLQHEPPASPAAPAPRERYAHSLLARPWDPGGDVPLNQAYLAATITAFSFVPLRGLTRLGYDRVTVEEQEAYLLRWNVAAELMGVRRDLLATTMDEAFELFTAVRAPRMARSDDGVRLAAALVDFMDAQVPGWALPLRALPRMIIHEVCDPGTPELLDIRLSPWEQRLSAPVLRMMRWWGRTEDRAMAELPPLATGMRFVFRRLSRDMISRERGWERGRFEIPPALRDEWNVPSSAG